MDFLQAELTGAQVTWRAIGRGSGMTAQRACDALGADTETFDGAVVVLGVNDAFRFTRVGQWSRAVTDLAKDLRGRGCQFVVVSAVPPVGRFPALPMPLRGVLGLRADLLDAALQRLGRSTESFTYCPVKFGTDKSHVASDGVHPSESGYQVWGSQLASACAACWRQLLGSTRYESEEPPNKPLDRTGPNR